MDRFVYSAAAGKDERDRALAKELVMGVLRWSGTLTALLRAMGRKPRLPFRDDWSLMVIQCGMVQVLFPHRVPGYAAIHSTVELIKLHSGKAVAGFANALLRKCAEAGGLDALIDRAAPGRREEVLLASYPGWLIRRLRNVYGHEEALALAMAMNRRPAVFVRVDGMDTAQAGREMRERLPGASVEAGRWLPNCLMVEKGGDLSRLDLYRAGKITMQDEGSQLAARALAAGGDDRVLDACCGMGIKTGQVARTLGRGSILAVDKSPGKVRMLRSEAKRLGLSGLKALAGDSAQPPLKAGALFDRILVDAPCSGTGTFARKPEIRFRLRKSDPKRMAALQEKILFSAARHLEKGGVLLYS
ncbi:MAG: transcription antitermination factor NusB, partial [Pseudomonadota bacterium]